MNIGAFAVVTSPETGNFLLGLRKDGKFDFFGGRCEKNELPPIAVIREFYEETNVVIHSMNLLDKIEKKGRIVWFYEVDLYETVVLKLSDEHTGYRWLSWWDVRKIPQKQLNRPSYLIISKLKEWYK